MNNPPYILVDVFAEIVAKLKTALNLPVLNYQYGYVIELNETLQQYNRVEEYAFKKFPLIWLAQPFTIRRKDANFYGSVNDLQLFIINDTTKNAKASQRMEENFKPVLYPIYWELMNQINSHKAISYETYRGHDITDRYYWGEQQQSVLNDVVDCLIISRLEISINHNSNC